jgi:hypothetical protein
MMICFAGASSGTRIKTDLRVQAQKRWLVTALQINRGHFLVDGFAGSGETALDFLQVVLS